jgi:hypothetical protein
MQSARARGPPAHGERARAPRPTARAAPPPPPRLPFSSRHPGINDLLIGGRDADDIFWGGGSGLKDLVDAAVKKGSHVVVMVGRGRGGASARRARGPRTSRGAGPLAPRGRRPPAARSAPAARARALPAASPPPAPAPPSPAQPPLPNAVVKEWDYKEQQRQRLGRYL